MSELDRAFVIGFLAAAIILLFVIGVMVDGVP